MPACFQKARIRQAGKSCHRTAGTSFQDWEPVRNSGRQSEFDVHSLIWAQSDLSRVSAKRCLHGWIEDLKRGRDRERMQGVATWPH